MIGKLMTISLGGLLLFASSAQATVYSWRDVGGSLQFSNSVDAVPEVQRASARQFVSKFATAAPAPVEVQPPAEPETTAVQLQMSAYERGLAQGLQTAEQQVALAGELARSVLVAVPRTPPPRIVVQQAGAVIIRDVSPDYYSQPFYGRLSPYGSPYWDVPAGPYCGTSSRFSSTRSLRCSRFVRHSHFFPGGQRSGAELFFPQGHFSHRGYLFGSGFVSR
ncbi:MAG: DUF4124 domain-containing protein [Deltaproteobacteria bacterium]|nr:DUF4124 domain-containing protein [Deltaproteobacteria bacterium]